MRHDSVAFSVEGTPLGILDARCWARDPDEHGKGDERKKLPNKERESMKWLNSFTRVAEIQAPCPEPVGEPG